MRRKVKKSRRFLYICNMGKPKYIKDENFNYDY